MTLPGPFEIVRVLEFEWPNREPEFLLIQGTEVYYGVNTPQDVFRVKGVYYCCSAGVWFMSVSQQGPWVLCTEVPKEIYAIPATHPKHNVTYVYVYDSTPDVVYVGYTPGYTGCYISGRTVVYGTA